MTRRALRGSWLPICFFLLCGPLPGCTGHGSPLLLSIATAPVTAPSTTPITPPTITGIQHLIIVVGENRSFDNVFGTYVPPNPDQKIWNLLSRGIVNADGSPGPNFATAMQRSATSLNQYQLNPMIMGGFASLPQPNTGFNALPVSPCFFSPAACPDPGLEPNDQHLLSEEGTRQLTESPDCRYPSNLPDGPFSLIGASMLNGCDPNANVQPTSFVTNTGDPVHRFFQNWQQSHCDAANITADDPSGCLHDLYVWVATTVGWGVTAPPSDNESTHQGGVAMGFYNAASGDFPYFRSLADSYAISDNYHQFIMGGTGPNSIALGIADVLYFTDANGQPSVPSSDQIENPDPRSGTNNFYKQDGFGSADPGSTGVAYVNCSDRSQPGVGAIFSYLTALPYKPFRDGNCDLNHYYLVNNDYPSYNVDGSPNTKGTAFPAGPAFAVGPQVVPTIGDALSANGISWKYYGEGLNHANDSSGDLNLLYCAICNPFQYSRSIMTSSLRSNLVDLDVFYSDLGNNQLPSVSFVKPDFLLDSHPGTSTPPLYEAFVRKLVNAVQAQPQLWAATAILITYDESGGYYDSGLIQPIDFFGDGPRTVLIAVSPFARRGFVDHTYTDHASIVKFIEFNWQLPTLSSRSRDNLPLPVQPGSGQYFPSNSPAIGDLTTMFEGT